MTRPPGTVRSRPLLVLASAWAFALSVTSVVLTALALVGLPDVLVTAGLLGLQPVATSSLAAVSWALTAVIGTVCAVLARPGAQRFIPPVAGTISLSAPLWIAAVLPGALWQAINGAASVPTAVPAGLTAVVVTSLAVAVIFASLALILADRSRRRSDAALATDHTPDADRHSSIVVAPAPRQPAIDPRSTLAPAAGGHGDGRPMSTVVTDGGSELRDSAVVHALKNVVTRIDETEQGWVVDGIVAHLRLHTAMHVPTHSLGYQFQLSNGALVTVSDQTFGKRRALDFASERVVQGWMQPLTMLIWPKDLPEDGGWFSWPMDGKIGQRMRRDIANAVEITYANRSRGRAEGFVLLDPLVPPVPLDRSDWPAGEPRPS